MHCLGDDFSDRLLISPKVIWRTPRANVGHVENRRAYASRSPQDMQLLRLSDFDPRRLVRLVKEFCELDSQNSFTNQASWIGVSDLK